MRFLATSFNKSLTFPRASELANSELAVRANKALTIDPSTVLVILSETFCKEALALLT